MGRTSRLEKLERAVRLHEAQSTSAEGKQIRGALVELSDEAFSYVIGGPGLGQPADPKMSALQQLANEAAGDTLDFTTVPPGWYPHLPPVERWVRWISDKSPEYFDLVGQYHARLFKRLEDIQHANSS